MIPLIQHDDTNRALMGADMMEAQRVPARRPPVLDGLIAAGGKLFLAMRDGKLTCWRGR